MKRQGSLAGMQPLPGVQNAAQGATAPDAAAPTRTADQTALHTIGLGLINSDLDADEVKGRRPSPVCVYVWVCARLLPCCCR